MLCFMIVIERFKNENIYKRFNLSKFVVSSILSDRGLIIYFIFQ